MISQLNVFLDVIKHNAKLHKVEDDSVKDTVIELLKGDATAWYEGLATEQKELPLNEFFVLLINQFSEKKLSAIDLATRCNNLLMSIRKSPTETVAQFNTKFKKVADELLTIH